MRWAFIFSSMLIGFVRKLSGANITISGEEVPDSPVLFVANHFTRFEYGVLGDYALSLGDGYLIHGTLYQRFLGLPVTHGCIRLNDENLELVYRSLQVGSKVYIY